jgi:hypothetical protein
MSDTAKPRLVITAPFTEEQWWFCGGPDVDDALTALAHLLRPAVENFLKKGKDGSTLDIQLEIKQLTDWQCTNLPDVP